MIFKRKKGTLALAVAFILSLPMMGCNANPFGKTTTTKTPTNETTKTETYSSERVKKIEDEVNKIKEVKGSTVVITGDRALVGINMQPNVEDAKTNQVKSEVEKAAKKADNSLKSVAVSSDVDIFTRISKVGEGLRSGRPFSEFGNEVEEIFRRVLPQ